MTERPYVFCHMITTLDGKITGSSMGIPEASTSSAVFYDLAFGEEPHYRHQGWLSGRVTTDDNFTHGRKPELEENPGEVPEGDHVANAEAEKYYISVDTSGRLGWDSNEVTYKTTTAHVLEVLTEKASPAYRAFLRKLGISYVIAGEEELDHELLLTKLRELFGIETLMLGGGGVLNWSFVEAGFCDEVSVVVAPVADGNSESQSLFEAGDRTPDTPKSFTLQSAEPRDGGSLWLRYTVDNQKESA